MKWKKEWCAFYLMTAAVLLLGIFAGNRAVTTLAEGEMPDRKVCIVIDPGHGGVDGGAISCTGKLESAYNLEISLRLNDLFQLLGYDTCMIRTEDISVYTTGTSIAQKKISDLKERVRIANETPNALLLSIHQNTFPESQYRGAQVFFSNTEESRNLAEQLQKTFACTVNPGSRRQAKKSSGVYLMEHIRCPGVLIECGFLSNPEEAARLNAKEYQQQLCCVIVSTVNRCLSNT